MVLKRGIQGAVEAAVEKNRYNLQESRNKRKHRTGCFCFCS